MAGIILKYETGNSTDVPINDDISKGELVLNTQAGKVWYGDNSGNFAQFKITTFDATADRLFYSDSSGDVQEIGLGSDGQVLTSTGSTSAPAFEAASGGGTVSSGAAKTFAVYNSAGTTVVDSDFNGTGEPDGAIYYDTTNYAILKLWRMDGSTSGTNGFGALYFGNEDFNSDFTAPNASIHCLGGGVTQASGSEGGAALIFKTIKAGDAAEETRLKLASDGAVELLGNSDNPAKLRLYEDTDLGTNYTEFKVGTQAADINYTLPTDDGTDGKFLQTDGDGVLSWEAPVAYGSSGSGNIDADNIGSGTLPMARLSGTLPALNGSALTNLPLAAQGALMDSEVTNLALVKALAKGISDGNVLTANDAVADNDYLQINGTEVEGRTYAQVRSDLGISDAEIVDWAGSSAGTIHSTNYTNTTYSVGDGGLTDNNFTDADHSKLNGIASSATANSGTVTSVAVTTATGLDGATTITSSGTVALSLDLSELSDGTSDIDSNDEVIYLDNGTEKRKAFSELKLSEFNNDSSWTSNSGDITSVVAGTGLTGGATSGAATLNVIGGTGITANADDIALSSGAALTNLGGGSGSTYLKKDGTWADPDTDTDTTYSAGNLLDLSSTTFHVDLSELTDGTADVVGSADELVYLDDGSQKRKQINEIKLGQFNNDQSWTSNSGDITAVTAGSGMSGGGTSGGVTLTNAGVTSIVAGSNISISGATGAVTVTATDTNTTYSVGDGGLTDNNFTDADHSKLNAIEASADVTDTSNVTSAGALMDSECTDLAAVKAFTGEAAATADQSASEIKTLLENGIDSVHYVDGSIDVEHLANDSIDEASLKCTNSATDNYLLSYDSSSSGFTWVVSPSGGGGEGDITGVDLTGGTGITIGSETGTTSGDYSATITNSGVTSIVAGTGVSISGATGAVTITNTVTDTNTTYSAGSLLDLSSTTFNVDLSELTDGTSDITSSDEVVYLDNGSQKRKAFSELKLSEFNNDSSWTSNSGDITAVTAGSGMSGGGTSGGVTLTNAGVTSIVAGSNISISGATGAVTVTATDTNDNTTYSAGSLLDLSSTTFNVDLSELTDGTGAIVGSQDELVYLDNGSQKRKLISEITLSDFSNDSGWTSNSGDITGVTAGTGLSGGGSSGGVTLNVDASQTQITSVGSIGTGTWAATDVAVSHGGTGSSSASGARSNLGVDPAGGGTGLNPTAISGLVDTTIADADYLMFWDATDSSMKKVDAAELTAGGGGGGVAIASGDTNNYVMTSDGTGDSLIGEAGLTFSSFGLTVGAAANTGTYKVYDEATLRTGVTGSIQTPAAMAANPFTGEVAIISTVDTLVFGGIVYNIP